MDIMLSRVRSRFIHHSASRPAISMLQVGPRPKINVDEIVRNADQVAVNAQQRKVAGVEPQRIVGLAKEHNEMIIARQKLEQQRNALSKKLNAHTSKAELEEARELKRKIQHTRHLEQRVENLLLEECLKVPNWTHNFTPIGSEDCTRIFKVIGSRRAFEPNLTALCHVELGKKLDWFDFETASIASGSRAVFLRNEAVFLEQALILWTLQECIKKGFVAIAPPSLVHGHALERCGFSPRQHGQDPPLFRIEGSDLCLSGTSEVLLAMTLYDKIIAPNDLPLKYVGINPCFRTELGSGAASRGIYRLHQFNKVELFGACELADADALHMEIVDLQVHLCSRLGLHCRLLEMPSEELGASAFRKLDMEAWMPGKTRDAYGEIMSASNCTDYQSRRLNARIKSPNEMRRFVATLNGTACATSRMMIAIMEQFQNELGVVIPEVLRPYMGGVEIVRFRS